MKEEFTFKIKHHKSGEWVAECIEYPGIITGGLKKGKLSWYKDVYPMLCEVIIAVKCINITKQKG